MHTETDRQRRMEYNKEEKMTSNKFQEMFELKVGSNKYCYILALQKYWPAVCSRKVSSDLLEFLLHLLFPWSVVYPMTEHSVTETEHYVMRIVLY